MSKKLDVQVVFLTAVVFYGCLAAVTLLRIYVFGVAWADIWGQTLFFGVILTLGLLVNIMPALDHAVNVGFAYYMLFLFAFFALIMPGTGYLKLAQTIATSTHEPLKIAFFVASGTIWVALVGLLCPTRVQKWLFTKLKALGWLTPLIFLFNYIAVSTVLFGFFAFYVYGAGISGELNSDSYLNLFGYHLLDSIPAMKIPETLRLTEPIPGERPVGLGFLVLLFKLSVLIPGIGAFRAYWKSDRSAE